MFNFFKIFNYFKLFFFIKFHTKYCIILCKIFKYIFQIRTYDRGKKRLFCEIKCYVLNDFLKKLQNHEFLWF